MKKMFIVAAVASAGLMGASAPAAMADANTTNNKMIIDTLNVIDKDRVARQINAQEFPDDKRIAVFLSDDKSLTKDNFDNDLTKYVLNSKNPDITDGKTINPNVLVLGWSPGLKSIRLIGGNKTGVNQDMTQKAYSAMIPLAKTLDYEEAITTATGAISSSYAKPGASSAASSTAAPATTTSTPTDYSTGSSSAQPAQTEEKKDSGTNFLPILLSLLAVLLLATAAWLWYRSQGNEVEGSELDKKRVKKPLKAPDLLKNTKLPSSLKRTKPINENQEAKEVKKNKENENDSSPAQESLVASGGSTVEGSTKRASSWLPPSLSVVEESLIDWRNLGRKYDHAKIEKPEVIDTIILELTKLKKNLGQVSEEQKLNSNWTHSIDNATVNRDKIIAKLNESISYHGDISEWTPRWEKEYRGIIGQPLITTKNSLTENAQYLREKDQAAINKIILTIAKNADKVNKAVLAGKVSPKDGEIAVRHLMRKLQTALTTFVDQIEPAFVPEGVVFYKDARSIYARPTNTYNLNDLMWVPERFANSERRIPKVSIPSEDKENTEPTVTTTVVAEPEKQ